MIKTIKLFWWLVFLIIPLALIAYFLKSAKNYPAVIDLNYKKDFFGITYSKKYAENIGLDWQETYLDILDELNVKQVRIPLYWDQIEKQNGVFDFSDYDFLIQEGEARGVEFILNTGMRVARWPECHIPPWINKNDKELLQDKTLKMLEASVSHFKKYKSIKYWQIENEPLLNSFGVCPPADYSFLKKEIALVRTLDDRPIIITATGELSFWRKEAKVADIFGTTMYRVVYNSLTGYIRYPYPTYFYTKKAKMAGLEKDKVFIIELQAEPWIPEQDIANIYDTAYQKSFNVDQFKANAQFAINTGFSKAYLWGAEWWYFKHRLGNNSEYWDFAKTLFK